MLSAPACCGADVLVCGFTDEGLAGTSVVIYTYLMGRWMKIHLWSRMLLDGSNVHPMPMQVILVETGVAGIGSDCRAFHWCVPLHGRKPMPHDLMRSYQQRCVASACSLHSRTRLQDRLPPTPPLCCIASVHGAGARDRHVPSAGTAKLPSRQCPAQEGGGLWQESLSPLLQFTLSEG